MTDFHTVEPPAGRVPSFSPSGRRYHFVHVPKTGGMTVCHLFGRTPSHFPVSRLTDAPLCERPLCAGGEAFTFAFVRDPWERLLSAYLYLLKGGRHNASDLADRKLLTPFGLDFSAFLHAFADDPKRYFAAQHLRPQSYWITDAGGAIAVDRIGRMERFDADLQEICQQLGFSFRPVVENATSRPAVREAFTRQTARLVSRIYAEDIDLLGYGPPAGLISLPPRRSTSDDPAGTDALLAEAAIADGSLLTDTGVRQHPYRTTDPCILTAADEPFLPGVLHLVRSIRRLDRDTPVICIDLGLSLSARRQVIRAGADLAARPACPCDSYLAFAPPKAQPWYQKPWFFDAAGPHRHVLWLDCDAVVIGQLDELLKLLKKGPLLTLNHGAAGLNKPELYERLPVPEPIQSKGCNAGVLGLDLDRDAALMRDWRDMTIRTLVDPDLQALVTAGDQGALLWCLHQRGIAHTINDDPRWNYPGYHTLAHKDRPARRLALLDAPDFIDAVADDHPEAAVVHFVAYPKPWQGAETT